MDDREEGDGEGEGEWRRLVPVLLFIWRPVGAGAEAGVRTRIVPEYFGVESGVDGVNAERFGVVVRV